MSPFMHIYSAGQWHGECYIVGNTEALKRLRDAIDAALAGHVGGTHAYAGDGEGFQTIVVKHDSEKWEQLAVHYTDAEVCATERREDAIWPHALVSKEEYKALPDWDGK